MEKTIKTSDLNDLLKHRGSKIIFDGDINFRFLDGEDFQMPIEITGNANFSCTIGIKDLRDLEKVGGSVDFGCSKIITLGKLRKIGGNVDLWYSKVIDLGKLEVIGGNLYSANVLFKDYSLDELKKIVRGDIYE